MLQVLKSHGVGAEALVAVHLTHSHIDHAGNLEAFCGRNDHAKEGWPLAQAVVGGYVVPQ